MLVPVLIHTQGKLWNYSCGTGKPNLPLLQRDKALTQTSSLIFTRIPFLYFPASVAFNSPWFELQGRRS